MAPTSRSLYKDLPKYSDGKVRYLTLSSIGFWTQKDFQAMINCIHDKHKKILTCEPGSSQFDLSSNERSNVIWSITAAK